ncbi:MAG TPA: sulfate/molybdate ABC transporter ATP-binding protein [Candidatus Acidoferrales bacterium]|jgi:molybdate transport system permease protein|nr:sulfate/molybdate ABC transporter ATP-binding protein [Candidatus Acidoferrales bacterium]
MSLEVAIEKSVPGFRLAVEFSADGAPLGLLGPSGSGKTMALRAIAGLETPDRGRIVLQGRVLFDSERRINVPARERRIGLLFQNYALFPHLTVAENIAFGLRRLPEAEKKRRVAEQLAAAHLEGHSARYPATLSGGEQQRVALARALAIEPAALLLDEPFSALDTHLRGALERQLREMLASYGGATLFVSHNLEEAYRVCETLVVLTDGRVAALGAKEEIFRHPPTLEVARVTGCKNFSGARRLPDGRVQALDWGCALGVAQEFAEPPGHVAIRAHHVRVHPAQDGNGKNSGNVFPCWMAAMTETPFRVTLDLRMGAPPQGPADFQLQAEVFKTEWETFRDLPQPWSIELAAERLFLLPE